MKCSACNGRLVATDRPTLTRCSKCGGLHGSCYRGDAVALVGLDLPMQAEATSPESLRYFDLTVVGSQGVSRTHGWFDAHTSRVVQYG
jgi:hypothetical protein